MSVKEASDKAIQKAREKFESEGEGSVHERSGSNPHAEHEQSRPFVNKDEPRAFESQKQLPRCARRVQR